MLIRDTILKLTEYGYSVNDDGIITSGNLKGYKVKGCGDLPPKRGDICIFENTTVLCVYSPRTWSEGSYIGSSEDYTFLPSNQIIVLEFSEHLLKDIINRFNYSDYTRELLISTVRILCPSFVDYIPLLTCQCCGKKISLEDEANYSVIRDGIGRIYCNKCAKICQRCGTIILIDDCDDSEEELCKNCAKRDYVLPYHKYYPKLRFYGKNQNNSAPYLGIELEVDEGGEKPTTVKAISKIMNKSNDHFIYCSHDGSLEDGFEIITQPATLKYHKSIKNDYEDMFKLLLSKGYLSHDTTTCGIHVHFNRDYYKDNEELYITRLLYLVDKFWDDIVKFSRRNQRRIDRFSKKVDIDIKSYYKWSNKSGNHDCHYYAVNLANQNTIEFRMFKGSLNLQTFMATLQFVNNCIIVAKEKTAVEIQSMKFEELITGRDCKSYWKTRKNRVNTEE